eukprot:jgi/Astpho2/4450/Aster-00060
MQTSMHSLSTVGSSAAAPKRCCHALPHAKPFLSGRHKLRSAWQANPRTDRGHQVAVHAALVPRFTRVVKGYTFFYGDAAAKALEDPRKMLDQAVVEMQEDLVKMRRASSEVLATQRMLETRVANAKRDGDSWYRRAQLALSKGEEELAREALRRRKTFTDAESALQKQLDQHTRATQQLLGNIRMLESKLTEAASKKETLKARAMSAQASKDMNEWLAGQLAGVRASTNTGLAAFNKMEEKVLALEAEVEAAEQMAPSNLLESKFAMLEGIGGSLDDDLDKLKADLRLKGKLPNSTSAVVPNSIIWE